MVRVESGKHQRLKQNAEFCRVGRAYLRGNSSLDNYTIFDFSKAAYPSFEGYF